MIFFYNLFLFILFFTSAISSFSRIKRRGFFFVLSKLGFGLNKFRFKDKKRVWIHAVSLGELKAAEGLFSRYRAKDYQIFISTSSDTGYARAKNHQDVHVFYLPIDFSFIMRRVVRFIQPEVMIITESDVWPQMLYYAKSFGAQCQFLNAKLSGRSFTRLKLFKPVAKWLYKDFDMISVQNQLYKERFLRLGVCSSRLKIEPNMKFDVLKNPLEACKVVLNKRGGVIMLSCTHEGEEQILLHQIQNLIGSYTLIVAPRHPERFNKVYKMLEKFGVQRSSFASDFFKPCVLVDQMGELDRFYSVSDVVVMGASFIKGIGGHNILEPLRHRKHILFGPFMENQMDLVDYVKENRSCQQIQLSGLYEAILKVFSKKA